jgi:hypothetical protein
MELSVRDQQVIRLVAHFQQLSTSHIAVVIFGERSATPVDRSLHRLVEQKYLVRIGRRSSNPLKGGAGAHVYQLGPRGWWWTKKPGRFFKRAVSEHTLKMADVYAELVLAERAGVIKLIHESEWHVLLEYPVAEEIRADIYTELGVYATKRRIHAYLEIDLGTERPRRIEEKLRGYAKEYGSREGGVWPYVLFIVPDGWRESEINRVIKRNAHAHLFSVCTFPKVIHSLMGFE